MGSVPVTEHAPSVVSLRRKEIALLLDALGASRVASGASGMSARCAQIRQLEQRPIADATPRKDTANNNNNRVSACGRTGAGEREGHGGQGVLKIYETRHEAMQSGHHGSEILARFCKTARLLARVWAQRGGLRGRRADYP